MDAVIALVVALSRYAVACLLVRLRGAGGLAYLLPHSYLFPAHHPDSSP
jgi:hypothetical protein